MGDDPQKQDQEKKTLHGYVEFARRNPRGAAAAIVLALIVAIVVGFGDWIGDKTKEIAQSVCESIGLCPPESDIEGQDWKIVFSTSVPHCQSGRLSTKLRSWSPPVTWQKGADRLVICGNAEISGSKENVPQLIQQRFPECLSVSVSPQKVTVTANLESGALCRAPYRFDGSALIKSNLPGGLFVCMPGHTPADTGQSFTQNGSDVPQCSEDDLMKYGFL